MSQSNPENKSQIQDNIVRDTNVGRDLIFAPVQAEKYIETEIIQISVAKVTQRELIKTSPYQGLKRFNLNDRDRFFGRDKLIARLFDAVNRSPLSFVLGASGSGKSSVVRAGLIPELKSSLENHKFYDFIFTPDEDPFDSLFVCLRNQEKGYNFSKSEAEIALKAEAYTLPEIISTLKKEDEKWLIFVDQFEQLFTSHILDIDKRNNFIESLVRVANSGDNSVKIMLAMRADFLEQLSSYPALGAIANENNIHLVTDMHPDELRQAIEQPAAKHGVVLEEGLVEQIIKEVEGQKGYLPLLQYTLDLLWQTECRTIAADGRLNIEDRTLNKTSYAALEGVRGALQKRVNEIYSNLNQDEQSATKQIFVKLVNIVDTESGSKTVSRRANRSEFVGELINNTLQTFIDENLLVSSAEYLSADKLQVSENESFKQAATVEIAHEILLSSWDRLKGWIEQEKEAIILKNWLASETKRWQRIRAQDESKAREELLKGSRLEQVVEFRKKDAFQNIGGLRAEENKFIDASVEWHDRQEKEKELRRKRTIMSLTGGLIGALVLSGIAGWQWRYTKLNEIKAINNLSKSLLASGQELDALMFSLKAGITLQQTAWLKADVKIKDRVTTTLLQVLYAMKEANRWTNINGDMSLSPDGKTLASADNDGKIQLWSLDGELLKFFSTKSNNERLIWSPNSKILASASIDTNYQNYQELSIKLWNTNGKLLNTFSGYGVAVSFSPDGNNLVIIDNERPSTFNLWSVDGELLRTFSGHNRFVIDLSWSPDGEIIASSSEDGTVRLWSVEGKLLKTLPSPQPDNNARFGTTTGDIWSLAWNPDGTILAAGGNDRTIQLWNRNGELIANLRGHLDTIESLSWTNLNDSNSHFVLASASRDGTVKLWGNFFESFGSPRWDYFKNIQPHSGSEVKKIYWLSDESKALISSGKDGTVRLWNFDGVLPHRNFDGVLPHRNFDGVLPHISKSKWDNQKYNNSQKFLSPDGKVFISATKASDTVMEIRRTDNQLLKTFSVKFDGSIIDMSWSPNNKTIALLVSVLQGNDWHQIIQLEGIDEEISLVLPLTELSYEYLLNHYENFFDLHPDSLFWSPDSQKIYAFNSQNNNQICLEFGFK